MEKGILLGWLSVIHWHCNDHGLLYPDAPALGRLIQCSNKFNWNDLCYLEVQELGQASGLPFRDYLCELSPNLGRPGGTAANPILIEDNLKFYAKASPVSVKMEFQNESKYVDDLGRREHRVSSTVLAQGRYECSRGDLRLWPRRSGGSGAGGPDIQQGAALTGQP
ncbi:hypothetical protein KC19_VG296700 [Ceratodon purpureus]|uniref:Uncharacterized protein n=1 Tax=Ceratodon purpureus TaxID=3225 RepID=A0A8T0HVW2_CERPU|nr:hypothetical protein KC19_VG296700 [Ceratodon purpureus]